MIRYIDLFCGIGGFRIAANQAFLKYDLNSRCVFSCDIDTFCQTTYYENFVEKPIGDIKEVDANSIPDHDLLFAGFPCQPFSIIGNGKGLEDTRGTLFFDIARILEAKKPKAFVLENVKRLISHNRGHTFRRILETLRELGYYVEFKVLNALDYGLPQKRERVYIVGFDKPLLFQWPSKRSKRIPLSHILENEVDKKYYASDYIQKKRKKKHTQKEYPAIWHENKAGNISSYPYSCALRANASHNYLLVNGERRLTPREMLRLQGFPDWFRIVVPDSQLRKQCGNAVPVTVVQVLLESLIPVVLNNYEIETNLKHFNIKVYSKTHATEKITTLTDS